MSPFSRHLSDLRQALDRLHEYSCQLNVKKCNFASQQLEYFGPALTRDVISPKTSLMKPRTEIFSPVRSAFKNCGERGCQTFHRLGHLLPTNFALFRHSCSSACQSQPGNSPILLDIGPELSLTTLRDKIHTSPIPAFLQWEHTFTLSTDASEARIGAVLEQHDAHRLPRSIHFLGPAYSERDCKCSTPEKELLAFVYAMTKFRIYLYCRASIWLTDAACSALYCAKMRSMHRVPKKLFYSTVV